MDAAQGHEFGVYAADTAGNVTKLDVFVGVDEIATLDNISMYPNPAVDNIRLDFTLTANETVKISLFNSVGKEVDTQNLGTVAAGSNSTNINVSTLTSGIYLMQVQIGNQTVAKTFYVK